MEISDTNYGNHTKNLTKHSMPVSGPGTMDTFLSVVKKY